MKGDGSLDIVNLRPFGITSPLVYRGFTPKGEYNLSKGSVNPQGPPSPLQETS